MFGVIFDQNSFKDKLNKLEIVITKDNFWSDNQKAQSILKQKNFLEKTINEFNNLDKVYNDLNDFVLSLFD